MTRKISWDRFVGAAGDCRPFPAGEKLTGGREPWRYGTDFRD